MIRSTIAAIAFAAMTGSVLAASAEDDRAEFKGYVATCVEEHGQDDKQVAACISDQVGALESYLGDILVETEGIVGQEHVPALRDAQKEWESYRDKSCAYHRALDPSDAERRSQLCRLRLVGDRIEEVLEGVGFADAEATE